MADKQAALTAEATRQRATVEVDVETLGRLFADDMVWIHGTGRVDTKSTMLNRIASKETVYHEINTSEVVIRELNDLVFISGLSRMKLSVGDQTGEVTNRYTIVWRCSEHKWQVVNWQSTPASDV